MLVGSGGKLSALHKKRIYVKSTAFYAGSPQKNLIYFLFFIPFLKLYNLKIVYYNFICF